MEITVPVEDITKVLTLRNYVGKGSFGDVPIELASSIPEASPIVKVGDRMFRVSIHDIARAIIDQVVNVP